jgi:hypothetical protein
MALRNWDSQQAKREMSRLIAPGLIGFYTHFEATEIFATQGKGAPQCILPFGRRGAAAQRV